jgi:FkbM family methyltransferase
MLTAYYHDFSTKRLLPKEHVDYLKSLNIQPKIIYDLGASVLHWTNEAQRIWPDAQIYQMDALETLKDFYEQKHLNYHIGAFADTDGQEVKFYYNVIDCAGCSINREKNDKQFPKERYVEMKTCTLDTVRKLHNWPMPDLIKMDCQSLEVAICKGGLETLAHCKDLIVELQHVEYNENGILAKEAIEEIEKLGFKLVKQFTITHVDGDYHFTKIRGDSPQVNRS